MCASGSTPHFMPQTNVNNRNSVRPASTPPPLLWRTGAPLYHQLHYSAALCAVLSLSFHGITGSAPVSARKTSKTGWMPMA